MIFNYPEGRKPEPTPEVEIGNVYASKNTHKTKAWVVMQISGQTVHLLGLDAEGEISSTQSYGLHSFDRRTLIGRVNLSAMEFDIEAAS
jgi:hypothetical protein